MGRRFLLDFSNAHIRENHMQDVPKTSISHSEPDVFAAPNAARRDLLKKTAVITGGAALMSLVPLGTRSAAWAAGSDAGEKRSQDRLHSTHRLRIGRNRIRHEVRRKVRHQNHPK
jgi:hypothetical protein